MNNFLETTHLSEIIELSNTTPVIIFKYSNSCGSSSRLKNDFQNRIESKSLKVPVFLVTVQTMKSLSQKIEEYFNIKHESPQVIILNRGKVTYKENHIAIKPDNFIFE
jgi:bacillithiol system protein YtxJ